jgi:hypothetical protein
MVFGVKRLAADWAYDAVSIGYPGPGDARPTDRRTIQLGLRVGLVRFW